MIKIKSIKNRNSDIKGFTLEGHAAYAPEGQDIVCSAISALSYTLAGALKYYDIRHSFIDEEVLRIKIEEEITDSMSIIIKTIETGYRQIAEQYSNYVSIDEGEL